MMAASQTSPEGYSQATRRRIVHTALSRVRARGFAPRPALLALYERYVRGELTRAELSVLLQARLRALIEQRAQ